MKAPIRLCQESYPLTPLDLQKEIAALPRLIVPDAGESSGTASSASDSTPPDPLQIVSRQGRLIMRLGASVDSLDKRYEMLASQLAERDKQLENVTDAHAAAERHGRDIALATIHLMDALDWVQDALAKNEQASLAQEVAGAQKDCLRRLAAVGITEVPTAGMLNGHLHQAVGTSASSDVPRYHVVSVVRRGFQIGRDVLRRAEVITSSG